MPETRSAVHEQYDQLRAEILSLKADREKKAEEDKALMEQLTKAFQTMGVEIENLKKVNLEKESSSTGGYEMSKSENMETKNLSTAKTEAGSDISQLLWASTSKFTLGTSPSDKICREIIRKPEIVPQFQGKNLMGYLTNEILLFSEDNSQDTAIQISKWIHHGLKTIFQENT